jgi:hypothetical protein
VSATAARLLPSLLSPEEAPGSLRRELAAWRERKESVAGLEVPLFDEG